MPIINIVIKLIRFASFLFKQTQKKRKIKENQLNRPNKVIILPSETLNKSAEKCNIRRFMLTKCEISRNQ